MEQNIGFLDRISRIVVAIAVLLVLLKNGKAVLRAGAASGYCALYTHLGISTSDTI